MKKGKAIGPVRLFSKMEKSAVEAGLVMVIADLLNEVAVDGVI